MSYEIITDKLEIRSSLDKTKPKYIVTGYALVPNKYDSFGYEKSSDGKVNKVRHSMFTPHCVESIKKQSKFKKLFVDSKHALFHDTNIKSMFKGKLTPEEEKTLDSFLEAKRLPIAKLNEINIDEKGLFIETELNPLFREVDESHQRYFDAIWYSLENKFLNGISINFIPTDVIKDEDGNEIINDVDISGFSYVDRPSLPEHNIVDVAIRSARDFLSVRESGDEKMEDEKKELAAEKAKLKEEREKIDTEKAELSKNKEEKEKEAKQTEIKKQEEEQNNLKKELEEKADALKKSGEEKKVLEDQLNKAKGQVAQTPPGQPGGEAKNYDGKFYKEGIAEITASHDKTIELRQKGIKPMIDKTMEGFSELINLQAKVGPTAGLDKVNADDITKGRLLERGKADIVTPKLKGE